MGFYPCHEITQIVPGLFLSGHWDVFDMVKQGVNVLVPLSSLDGSIWDHGFRGEIMYCPIKDFGTLPDDVLDKLVTRICSCLDNGKKVGLFCGGGHGRTGYVAACVLARQGIAEPVEYLHEHYCRNAVETTEQFSAIAHFIDMEKQRSKITDESSRPIS